MSEHGWLDELFEAQEARHPLPAGLRRNVVASVTSTAVPERRPSTILVLAAAALVVVVVGSLIAIGRLARPTGSITVHQPTPAASPTPGERDYGPVPAGVAVTYAIDPRQPSWLIAYDTSGRPVGTVKLPVTIQLVPGLPNQGGGASVTATADGSRIMTPNGVYDRDGHLISTGTAVTKGGLIADDGIHACAVDFDQTTLNETLETGVAGQALHAVRLINREPNVGQTGDSIGFCSYRHDLAVVVRTAVTATTDAWFVQLSTGALLSHLTSFAGPVTSLVFSPDGRYVAEDTRIVRVSDGRVVANLGQQTVYQFVGDNDVITTQGIAIPTSKTVALVDWSTGRTVWSYQGSEWVAWMQPLSDSAWVLYLTTPIGNAVSVPCSHLVFVDANGEAAEVTGVNLYPVTAAGAF